MEDLIKILLIIGIYQSIVTAAILFTRKTNRTPNRFLSMMMLIIGLPMLNAYIFIAKIQNQLDPIFKFILILTGTLFGPLVYFYTYNMINIDKPLKSKKILPHFIPFIIISFIIIIIRLHWNKPVINFNEVKVFVFNYKFFIIPILIFNPLSGLTYTLYSYHKLIIHTKSVQDFYSDIERISLLWLKKLLSFLLIFFTIIISFHTIRLFFFIPKEIFILIPMTALSVIFFTSYYGFQQPDIFLAIRAMHNEIDEENDNDAHTSLEDIQKYKKHNLHKDTAKNYVHKLEEYMIEQKPYLNDSLTLTELADSINIPSHHLSIVLNQYLNQNFYNFISYYRVEEAKKLLKDEEYLDVPVLKIAFDSGFNSKSAFNKLFKKSTGKTPTEYRKEYFSDKLKKVS